MLQKLGIPKSEIFHDALKVAQDGPDFEKTCAVPDDDADKVSAHLRLIKELIKMHLLERCQTLSTSWGRTCRLRPSLFQDGDKSGAKRRAILNSVIETATS